MRSQVVAGGLLALLGSARVEAEDTAVALIWKGARTQAEAQKSSGEAFGEFLTGSGLRLPEGYPKLIDSKTLPGLKPDFWVWLVGVCPSKDAGPVLEHLKRFSPGAYGRDVSAPGDAKSCPTPGGTPLRPRDESLKLASGESVRVFTREERESVAADGSGDDVQQTRFHFVRFNKGGEFLHAVDTVSDEDFKRGPNSNKGIFAAYRCTFTSLKVSKKAGQFVLARHCTLSSADCGPPASWDEADTVTANRDSTLEWDSKQSNEVFAPCD
jgi:hypothetical protein